MNFIPPDTIEEANSRITELKEVAQKIISQLINPNKLDHESRRMTLESYKAWSDNAFYALQCKLKEIRALRSWSHRKKNALEHDNDGSFAFKGNETLGNYEDSPKPPVVKEAMDSKALILKLYEIANDVSDLEPDEVAVLNHIEEKYLGLDLKS